jgi:hypothetical protein
MRSPLSVNWDACVVALKGGVWAATFTVLVWVLLDVALGAQGTLMSYVNLWFPALGSATVALYQREIREWPLNDD